VVPPVPYAMRVTVEITDATSRRQVEADVRGDLVGAAALELRDAGAGASEVRVRWTVEMCRPAMRTAARVARPMLIWGHDRVVEATVRRLRRHLASLG
jgi:Ribonuclease G/E